MKKIYLRDGFVLNLLSERVATITSSLPDARPNWRISYFGFDDIDQASEFDALIKAELKSRLKSDKQFCVLRPAKRLRTKHELKVRNLSKIDVLRYQAYIERRHTITFVEPEDGLSPLCVLVLNGTSIGKITRDSKEWFLEYAAKLDGCSHAEARRKVANLVLSRSLKS